MKRTSLTQSQVEILENALLRYGNIVTLLDSQATHTGIGQAFSQLARRIGPGDFVYIQYAGHGAQTKDLNGDERSGKDQT